jgi:hypothetical protein
MDDLSVATVLMMVGGQLVLLRPRRVSSLPRTWLQRGKFNIFHSQEAMRSSTTCKYLPIASSFVGPIFVVSEHWKTLFGATMAKGCACGLTHCRSMHPQATQCSLTRASKKVSTSHLTSTHFVSKTDSYNTFYVLTFSAVLMDKGIIIGVEHEVATRTNLPFVMFRHATSVSPPFVV